MSFATYTDALIAVNTLANNAHRCTTPSLSPEEATALERKIRDELERLHRIESKARKLTLNMPTHLVDELRAALEGS